MDEITERYTRISSRFTELLAAVPDEAWDNDSPCDGWTARDVVRHLTDWITDFFGSEGVTFAPAPPVDDDPVAAWTALDAGLRAALADPALASRTIETPMGSHSLAETVDMIVVGDVFTHGWDIARATGQDETLDADQVQRMLASMGAMPDEVLRAGGMFGPRIEVPDDADDQTKFLAIAGRRA